MNRRTPVGTDAAAGRPSESEPNMTVARSAGDVVSDHTVISR